MEMERKRREVKEPYLILRGRRGVSLAVWRTFVERDDGSRAPWFKARAQRAYKQSDGTWNYTDYIPEEAFLELAELLRIANGETLAQRHARVAENEAAKTDEETPW